MSDKEFKAMVMKILTRLERQVEDLGETFNKEQENIKNQSEMKNSGAEGKNTLEGITSRLEDAEKRMRDLQDKVMESN